MNKVLRLAPVAALAAVPSVALAQTGPDYSTLTSQVDFTSTITAILSVGALAVGLALVVVGIRKIKRMVSGA